VYAPSTSNFVLQKIWLILTLFKLRGQRFDAIYTNGQGGTIAAVGKWFKGGSRWVHHHHTSGDAADQATWPSSYKNAIRDADLVIACSSRNANDIRISTGVVTATIPCFSRDAGQRSAARKEFPRTLRFGYFGRLIPEKGIDLICELSMSKALADVEFHLWGEEGQYSHAHFSSYPNVNFHGPFSSERDLRDVVHSIDAFVLLSVHPEGLPISLLEVMSAGLPWIATDRGGISDIACDQYSTVLLPRTPTLAAALSAVNLLSANIRAGTISGEAQRKLYLERFSVKAVGMRWLGALFGSQ
jgi:glycosyltransferase involved in cell wall biosynthesis